MKKCSMQKKIESLGKKSETLGDFPQEVMDFINNDSDFQTLCKENHVDKSNIEMFLDAPEYVLSIHECSDLDDMFDEMDEIVEYLHNEGLTYSEIETFLNLDSSIYTPGYGGVHYWDVGKFNYLGLSGLVYPERSDTNCKDLIISTRKYRDFIDRCKKEMADDTLALNALEAIDNLSESKKCEDSKWVIELPSKSSVDKESAVLREKGIPFKVSGTAIFIKPSAEYDDILKKLYGSLMDKSVSVSTSESKKSEVKDNEIPYVMMQYYVPDEKVWEPILVEINSNDTGWFYDGLALMDNLGNFGYDEFSWDFIHQRCKRGTDKCDPELVQSMEKSYLKDFTSDDEYQPRKVDRLGNHIPKGKTYIGKD